MQGTTYKDCQQNRFYAMFPVIACEDHLADPDTVYVFANNFGVFGDGTRLAMPKTRLRAGLIIIEAWFTGY